MPEIDWQALNELPQVDDWQLLFNTDESHHCYLLIDQCRIDQCMRKVFMATDLPAYEYLYLKTDSQHLLEVSPVLIECTNEPWVFAELITEMRVERAGLIIESTLPHAELANHLRRYLLVPDPAGESFLRFYDPAIWLALVLQRQHGIIKDDAITQVILPHWLKTEPELWVSDQSEQIQVQSNPQRQATQPPTSGKNLKADDEFDELAIRTKLLYWVGQHEALQGQDWMMEEFQELFEVVQTLIRKGLICDWELNPWILCLVQNPEQISSRWLNEWLETDITNLTESDIEHEFIKNNQQSLIENE